MSGAHGLDGRLAARDWPKLTVAELAPVFAAFPGLGAALQVVWHSRRPFAASALVAAEGGEVFVKRHDTRVRTVGDLAEEHAFMAHLGDGVPRVLGPAVAGELGVYEVHAVAAGEDRYRDDVSWSPVRGVADAAALGRALARLHRAAAGFAAPARRARMLVAGDALLRKPDPVAVLGRRLAAEPMLAAALAGRDWRADFERVLLAWHQAAWPVAAAQKMLWVHGDFHTSNTLWLRGEVCCVLDFGLSNRASAAFDLATAIERNCVAWLELCDGDDVGRVDLARALLAGYAAGAGLRAAVAALLPVVHLDFAVSELGYFHGVTGSPAGVRAAYSDFLLGHAAWFASRPGRAFLDGLAD